MAEQNNLALKDQKAALFKVENAEGGLSKYQLPSNVVSAQEFIPQPVQAILKAQFEAVGLKFDISKLALNKDNRQTLVDLRTQVTLIQNNAKLLPMFARELKKAIDAGVKMAQFKADMVDHALKAQIKIDQAHVDTLLAFAGYESKRNRLQMKLQKRLNSLAKQEQAAQRYYNTTWGREAQAIDAHWDDITEIALGNIETSQQASSKSKERAKANQEWIREAHSFKSVLNLNWFKN